MLTQLTTVKRTSQGWSVSLVEAVSPLKKRSMQLTMNIWRPADSNIAFLYADCGPLLPAHDLHHP